VNPSATAVINGFPDVDDTDVDETDALHDTDVDDTNQIIPSVTVFT
jgi:hypothetical protein